MHNFEIKQDIHIEIPEHQILLSFINDDDAQLFYDWFYIIGKQQFEKWANEQQEI